MSEHGASEADVAREAERLLELADRDGTTIRLLGGIGIAQMCPSARAHPSLKREYGDIDIVALPGQRGEVVELLERAGYAGDQEFNGLHGGARLLFFDDARERQLDVFLGVFRMCHTIDLRERLLAGYRAVPLADLVLTKLQIVELNEKDARDVLAIFLDHDVRETESQDSIDVRRITDLCGRDWGLYTTITDNATKLGDVARRCLEPHEVELVNARVQRLLAALESTPKSFKWRTRSRVGRRVAWYELPEEVQDALA
jgi:hypothetical protein